MDDEDRIAEEIDNIVDEFTSLIERKADQLGLGQKEIADRVANELKARSWAD